MNYSVMMCGLVVSGFFLGASETVCNDDGAKKVYFAGPLFDAKHLVGNALLAEAIKDVSGGRYECMLPQNLEGAFNTGHAIRDVDLLSVVAADVGIFNYDGTDVDAGTVVEFVYSKVADKPAVILRTDMRTGGEHSDYPWNLMTSYYPRTEVVIFDAMQLYKQLLIGCAGNDKSSNSALSLTRPIAEKVVAALDKVMQTQPIMPREGQDKIYQWLSIFPGFKDRQRQEEVLEVLRNKRLKASLAANTQE